MERILIAEDEERLGAFLDDGLTAAGYAATVVGDGPGAVALARDEDFDLLILDLGLPGLDGMEVLRALRAQGRRLPVLILSARDDSHTKVEGLELGANDYLTKPFGFDELLARVRVRLRDAASAERPRLVVDDVVLDLRDHRATVGERPLQLSAREFTMLEVLLGNAGRVVTREEFLSRVWGYQHDPGSNVVEVYIGYLRRKVGRQRIVTVRGMGYSWMRTGSG
ncbi:MAG: response regulator transcription factor [Solirubrobacteraceae bacterium MAG38_C4-C5]|nr:response regulator transcription factor [Candidatus Siliceabacter maunaloa]